MNALVLQCGGPTAVVNVSLAALVRRWRALPGAAMLHGGRHGLGALVSGDWIPLSVLEDTALEAIENVSGMALGGGRDRLSDADLDSGVGLLDARNIDTLFLIGGNGTMAAGRVLSDRALTRGVRLRLVGIPKTIDNDIPVTDVSPGFASAARFMIDAVRDVGADVSSMRGYEDVVLFEVMGRHSGWLAAATQLARARDGDAPHLVLIPEQPVSDEDFLAGVRDIHARFGVCAVSVAEGVRDASGRFLAAKSAAGEIERDASGQIILGRSGGPLPYLATLVRQRLGLRCRLVRPDVLQRCSRAHVSALDRKLAALVGTDAVDAATMLSAYDAVMIALRCRSGTWKTETAMLAEVRGERTLPPELQADPSPLWEFLK